MRHIAIAILVAAVAPRLIAEERTTNQPRPNILVIYGDDQSYRTVGCYEGSPDWITTPNLDQLAADGIRFTHAYAGSWCMASRAMFLSGRHPHAIEGISMRRNPHSTYDSSLFRFWPTEFRKQGYTTACIGKWHLSADTGHGRAWDHSVIWNHAVPERANDYYVDQYLNFDGGDFTSVGGYSTDNYTKYAVEFIRREHAQPWFLWLCYDGVHGPFLPAERHADRYRSDAPVKVPSDIFPPRPTKPAYVRDYTVWKRGANGEPVADLQKRQPKGLRDEEKTLTEAVQQYHRAVLALDEGVGQVLQALKESGQLDNTLVVYTADQGFAFGQHGFTWKLAPYDAMMRVPFIVRMPSRFAQGEVCRHPVTTLDLIPTIHQLAAAPLPWTTHGHDLTPLLQKPDQEWPHPVMLEHFFIRYGRQTDGAVSRTYNVPLTAGAEQLPKAQQMDPSGDTVGGIPWWVSLRQGRYKYIRNLVQDEIEELYDLQSDPEELTNLAVDPRYAETLFDFRQRLTRELERTGARFIQNLPKPPIAWMD